VKCPPARNGRCPIRTSQGGSRLNFYLTRYNISHVPYLDSSMAGIRCSGLQIADQLVYVENSVPERTSAACLQIWPELSVQIEERTVRKRVTTAIVVATRRPRCEWRCDSADGFSKANLYCRGRTIRDGAIRTATGRAPAGNQRLRIGVSRRE